MILKQINYDPKNTGRELLFSNKNTHSCSSDETIGICKETIEFELEIYDEIVVFQIIVQPEMIKLSQIVPLAREISSEISTIIQAKVRGNGTNIPCQKGCATCCNYLVPLSIPEVFRLKAEINAMPEEIGKAIFNSFLASAKSILKKESSDFNSMDMDDLSRWYSQLELPCPFLSDNNCSIYTQRPIACREYLVTGSNSFCKPTHMNEFKKIDLPVSVLECVGKLSAELNETDIEAVMMPLTLLWAQEYPERDMKTWPSVEIVSRLAEIIKETVENSCAVSTS